jgi:hypothetical protein
MRVPPGLDELRVRCSSGEHTEPAGRTPAWWRGYGAAMADAAAESDRPAVPADLAEIAEKLSALNAATFELLTRSADLKDALSRAGGAS